MWYKYLIEVVMGYLMGSISPSVLLTKIAYKKDVRSEGSGNAGATNVARVFGLKAGFLTLGCDVLKIVIPMLVGMWLQGDLGVCVAGIAGILGHCFPLYFNFKGGKGVSVAVTIAIFLGWQQLVIGLSLFILIMFICRIVSIGSMIAATSLFVTTLFVAPDNVYKLILSGVTALLIVFMHRENIARLIKGEEKKFTPKSKKG